MITITHSPVTYGNPTHYVGHNYMFYLKEELHKLVHLKVAYTIALVTPITCSNNEKYLKVLK